MFVLHELDKILESLALWHKNKRQTDERMRISLADLERIDVSKMQLSSKVSYSMVLSSPSVNIPDEIKSARAIFSLDKVAGKSLKLQHQQKHFTSDALFASMMNPLVLSKLTLVPERHYPSAKLIVCDRSSYNLLMKLKRISSLSKFAPHSSTESLKNFIYKPPFNVTAIFLLADIIDLFDRQLEPIIISKRSPSTGEQEANFNYSLIRQTFPYLKMSDLIILLQDKDRLELGNIDMEARRENHILQFLNHFARSAQLIELNSLNKSIGELHLIYDNVIIVQSSNDSSTNLVYNSKLPLSRLSFMAERLVSLSDRLHLNIKSISFRIGDPYGQTKVFSQFISNSLASKPDVADYTSARVIVLDRFYDLQGPLLHADRYGAFLEQEKQIRISGNHISSKLRMDNVDELDEKLQLNQLTEVLGTIIRYASGLKPKELQDGKKIVHKSPINKSLSSAVATSQSIRRHLDMVKIVYKCLNEGYLLVLRIESSLENIINQLRSLTKPLPVQQQHQLGETIQRVMIAFKQLIKTSGKSMRAIDIIRVACILIDVINMFLYIHNRDTSTMNKATHKTLNDIRLSILSGNEFKKALKSKLDPDDELERSIGLFDKLGAFDKLSRDTCGQRSTLSIEQILEKFYSNQLEKDSYPTVSLLETTAMTTNDKFVVALVFLGSMTPNELSRVKAFEDSLKKNQGTGDIYILICGLSEPEDFLKTL